MNTQNRKLGRGLDALIPLAQPAHQSLGQAPTYTTYSQDSALVGPGQEAEAAKEVVLIESHSEEGRVHWVDPRSIRRNPAQPRQDFDEESISELAASIRSNGILQPILVRRLASDELELVAGERRWRAAQLLELGRIPVLIRDLPADTLEVALIENIQREDLNPVDEAMALARLKEAQGLTQEQLASRLGKKRSTIANSIRLLELPSEILDSLRSGQITLGHAKVLLSVPPEKQHALHASVLREELSVRDLERLVAAPDAAAASLPGGVDMPGGQEESPGSGVRVKPPHLADEEQIWSRHLGTKVEIREGKGRGRIQLHFFSTDDYERLKRTILSRS